jgi:hypothetical protein
MTTDQWHPAKPEPDWTPKVSSVKEVGLRIIDSQYGLVIQHFSRTASGFVPDDSWTFPHGLMSESELQDIITTFTKRFIEHFAITPGVKLVLDS